MELLGKPRIVERDLSLEARVEAARYSLPVYSDAHWIYGILATYRDSCSGTRDFANIRAAACERVLQAFSRVGVKSAKKLAAKLEGFGLPGWIPLPDDQWAETCQAMQRKLREEREGD